MLRLLAARLIPRAPLSIRRLVSDPGVSRAIRKAFHRLIPAEPEVHGAWIADRPAAFLRGQLKQRAVVSAGDGHFFGRRLLLGAQRHEDLITVKNP